MSRKILVLLVFGIITIVVSVFLLNNNKFKEVPISSGNVDKSKEFYRTRFDHLTSDVWRYKKKFQVKNLQPVLNNNPHPEEQPHRDRPAYLTLNSKGSKLYVSLQGTEAEPGHEVAVIDIAEKKLLKRITVGSRPYKAVLHPGGRFMVVVNELSNYATVIDTVKDEVSNTISVDYYCQGLVFSKDGKRAWVANRYLDQILKLNIEETNTGLHGKVEEIGGFDDKIFYGKKAISEELKKDLIDRGFSENEIEKNSQQETGGINAILKGRCKNCHNSSTGNFISGDNQEINFLSAVENSIGGNPAQSYLLKAVTSKSIGGFGDQKFTPEFHSGGVLFEEDDPDLQKIVDWIKKAKGGPGIRVGNEFSHPKDLSLSTDGKYLFVGNTGTMDLSIVDIDNDCEVGGIFVQNVVNGVFVYPDKYGKKDLLLMLSFGAGFGGHKARDPHGGETWDSKNPAVQYATLRDPKTTDTYSIEKQHILGPYLAVDGTWNFKMRDIQNDLIVVDLSQLKIPKADKDMNLDYVLRTNKYESHKEWVRYTSDMAEATIGDIKGDIPPELQRVAGAFPEDAAIIDDRLYVVMGGSFEVVELQINPYTKDSSEKLVPLRKFTTGLRPIGIAAGAIGPAKNKLFVANQLGESVSIINLSDNTNFELAISNLTRPPLDTDAEKGELIVHSSIFSSDKGISCQHCHYRDTGDGRGWGAAETVGQTKKGHLTSGGTLGIPQMRNIFPIQPYYFEGTHILGEGQGADINEPASSIDFAQPTWAGDFTDINSPVPNSERWLMHEELKERVEIRKLGKVWYDLEERRDEFLRQQSMQYFDAAHTLSDFYRFVGTWLGSNNHLLPNPFDQENPSVKRGKGLFNSAQVMCGVCHTAPEFTNKTKELADNETRILPQLTTLLPRDGSYTLVSVHALEVANGRKFDFAPGDRGRVEGKEGRFTTMQLRGIFDRPPVFLHHARTRSLREVVLTPQHSACRRYSYPVLQGDEEVRPNRMEIGFNETTEMLTNKDVDARMTLFDTSKKFIRPRSQVFDTHGGTSHLTPRQIEDLVNFMKSIE